jgi:hypothetical protein
MTTCIYITVEKLLEMNSIVVGKKLRNISAFQTKPKSRFPNWCIFGVEVPFQFALVKQNM